MINLVNNTDKTIRVFGIDIAPGKQLSGQPDSLSSMAARMGFTVVKVVQQDPFHDQSISSQSAKVQTSNAMLLNCDNIPVNFMTPTLSIMIPVHGNRIESLQRLFDSIPLIPDLEIILAHSGPSEQDASSYLSLLRTLPHETIFIDAKNHYGIGSTRNLALSVVSRPWCVMMDSDDEFAPGALDAILHSITMDPGVDVIYGQYERDGELHDPPPFTPGLSQSNGCYMMGARCFRTSLLQSVMFSEEFPFAEDIQVLIVLEKIDARFRKIDRVLTLVHGSKDSVTTTHNKAVGKYAHAARSF